MSKYCGGSYEIARESERVSGSTGMTPGAVLVGPSPVVAAVVGALSTSTHQIIKSIEFRCNNTRKAIAVPEVTESSSRAEKLRADLRRQQADKESAAGLEAALARAGFTVIIS